VRRALNQRQALAKAERPKTMRGHSTLLLPKFFVPATGGLQIATGRIAEALVERRWCVSVHFPAEPAAAATAVGRAGGAYEIYSHPLARREFWQRIPSRVGTVSDRSVLAVGVEYEDSLDAQIAALGCLKASGAKVFLRVATTGDLASRLTEARALALDHLDGIVVLNREMHREACRCQLGDHVHLIPVMVDTWKYRPDWALRSKVRARLGIAPNTPVVLYAGRLDPRKGIKLLFEAMAGVEALLWIVGDPTNGPNVEDARRYRELAAANGPGAVRLDPGLPEADIPAVLNAADTFVTASRVEGMSNAVLEASSVGLSIASFAIPGIQEIAETCGMAGFHLVPPEAGSSGLRRAIESSLQQRPAGNWRLSRETALAGFSLRTVGDLWDRLLRRS
jgi:glycosyltransferase involved in cell wall biosynthesis